MAVVRVGGDDLGLGRIGVSAAEIQRVAVDGGGECLGVAGQKWARRVDSPEVDARGGSACRSGTAHGDRACELSDHGACDLTTPTLVVSVPPWRRFTTLG